MEETSQPATGTESSDNLLSQLATIVDGPSEEIREEDAEQGQAEPEQAAQEEVANEPEKYKVKVNGQEIEVPLEELIAGYQKDSDYRQKTAEVAEQRRQAEQQSQQAQAEISQALTALNQATLVLQAELGQFDNIPWMQLATEDPAQYVQLRAQFDAKVQRLNELKGQQNYVQQIDAQHQEQLQAQSREQEKQQLLANLSEWNDPAIAQKESAAITQYLQGFGLNEAQMHIVNSDHKAVILARKAMLYDALMAKQPQAMQQVKQAPQRVEKPGAGTRPADQRTTQMKQLNRTGNVRDAAPLMKQFLQGN